jgi:7-methyl-GTP pyrophosphatase
MLPVNSKSVILASQAAWRSDLLRQIRIEHTPVHHRFEEPKYEQGPLDKFIENIACEKAKSLEGEFPDSIIIAADQLASVDDQVLYKPGSKEKAIKQLELLNNREHKLICAVAVLFEGKVKSKIAEATLKMRELTREEMISYVEYDKPWDCAGAYKYESLGASLFERVEVEDPSTIIGLPVNHLITLLREWGLSNLMF